MDRHTPIAIIGPGRVGTALGTLAARAGLTVAAVGARRADAAAAAAERIGEPARAMDPAGAAALGQLVLLTVSDDAIQPLCEQLAATGAFLRGAVVAHCAGVLGSEVLAAAADAGCHVGSMHPLQSFPAIEVSGADLTGVSCFCEGDDTALAALTTFARQLGGTPVTLSSAGKALYHAAAVTAGNYVTTLLDAAVAMCEQAGISPDAAREGLAALAAATAANAGTMDLPASLTGPVARGDVGTIRRHLAAMEACPADIRRLYGICAMRTVDLAVRKGSIDPATARQLRQILTSETPC